MLHDAWHVYCEPNEIFLLKKRLSYDLLHWEITYAFISKPFYALILAYILPYPCVNVKAAILFLVPRPHVGLRFEKLNAFQFILFLLWYHLTMMTLKVWGFYIKPIM